MADRAERDRRYNASEKGRARHSRYNDSEKGQARRDRWEVDVLEHGDCQACGHNHYLTCKARQPDLEPGLVAGHVKPGTPPQPWGGPRPTEDAMCPGGHLPPKPGTVTARTYGSWARAKSRMREARKRREQRIAEMEARLDLIRAGRWEEVGL